MLDELQKSSIIPVETLEYFVMVNFIRRFKYRFFLRQLDELTPFQKALCQHISQATKTRH